MPDTVPGDSARSSHLIGFREKAKVGEWKWSAAD